MNLHDLGHHIAQSAPLLGSALAGPGGAAVGSLIAAKFGGNVHAPDALHALITADPEAALKLKQMESDHELALQRLTLQAATDQLQAILNDRSSARQREVVLSSTPLAARDRTPAILAYGLTGGLFAALAFLFCGGVPEANESMILGILSSLTTVWVGAMAYYHGSSIGSREKEAGLIQHLHRTAPSEEKVSKVL